MGSQENEIDGIGTLFKSTRLAMNALCDGVQRGGETYQSTSAVYACASSGGAVHPFWLSELPETFF